MIVRLCRTYPRDEHPGIGLHCYNFTKHIDKPTIIFTKYMESTPISVPKNAQLIEIKYSDLSFNKKKESLFRTFLIILSKLWAELVFGFQVIRYLKNNNIKISILHLHSINFLITAISVKVLFHCRSIMNFGGTDLMRLKNNKILMFLANRIDAFLYVAKSMKPDVDKLFPNKKNFYMGNGVDLTLFAPKKNDGNDSKNFLAVGNLRWQKGYEYLLDAFSQAMVKYPSIKLYIAGEGPQRVLLEQKIETLKLKNNVFLLGVCSREDVARRLNESYGFIMSSVSEGFPKALIESIACETPVISTDVGECSEISRDVGIVVPAANSNALSKAIIELLEQKHAYKQMKSACSKKRLDFSWAKMTARVRKAYRTIDE